MKTTKKEILAGMENIQSSKLIANNTVKVILRDGTQIIRLHRTNIVTIKNGVYTLNSGGWQTLTTKDRINTFAPVRIYQKDFVWYIDDIQFFDGIKINSNGDVLNKSKAPQKSEKKRENLKKKITNFVNQINENNLPYPDNGDCFLCRIGSTDCLHSHIKENYLHGSLLVAAMRSAGYNDMQISVHYQLKLIDTFKRQLKKYLQKNLMK